MLIVMISLCAIFSYAQEQMEVAGAIKLEGATGTDNSTIEYDAGDFSGKIATGWKSLTSSGGGSGIWSLNGSSAYYNGGNGGIGTMTPGHTLEVNGDMRLSGNKFYSN